MRGGSTLLQKPHNDCGTSHSRPDTACLNFETGVNGRCVYCDHPSGCHPGPGGPGTGSPFGRTPGVSLVGTD